MDSLSREAPPKRAVEVTFSYVKDPYPKIDSDHPFYRVAVRNKGTEPLWVHAISSSNFAYDIEIYREGEWKSSGFGSTLFRKSKIGLGEHTLLYSMVQVRDTLDGERVRVSVRVSPSYESKEWSSEISPEYIFHHGKELEKVNAK